MVVLVRLLVSKNNRPESDGHTLDAFSGNAERGQRMIKWLDELKTGDAIIVCSRRGTNFDRVTRTTKTFVIIGEIRFSKKTGFKMSKFAAYSTASDDPVWLKPISAGSHVRI